MTPERRKRILTLALPIIGGMVSQNVLNLVDTAMVGSLGDAALAGVGLGAFLNFLLTSPLLGLGAGVQAMAARRVGEGREDEVAVPLNGGLVVGVCVGIPLSAVLIATAAGYFPWVSQDAAVIDVGVPYLQARLVAMVAMGANVCFRGHWNATDRSMLYMRTIVVMHVINISLNWVLIYGNLGAPALGATGAGIASAVATWAGALAYFGLAMKRSRHEGFLHGLPSANTLRTMIRVSLPMALQQFFFAAGMTLFLSIVGRVGTSELAASKVVFDLLLVAILPAMGFGLAGASLVGQSLGRGNPDNADRWAWDVSKLAAVVVGVIGAIAVAFPETILSGFIPDASTRALGVLPLRMVGAFMWLDAIGIVLTNAHIGAGATRRVMVVSIVMQWALMLPAVYVFGYRTGGGMIVIWVLQVIYRQLQSLIFIASWKRGGWRSVRVE